VTTVAVRMLRHNASAFAALAMGVVLLFVVDALRPGFASVPQLRTLAVAASVLGFAAAAQTLVILVGGIDLSIPWVMNGAAVLLTIQAHGHDGALAWVVPALVAGGAAVGCLNGIGVGYLGVSPIVMTLGMNAILQGGLLAYTRGLSGGFAPPGLVSLVNGTVVGFPTVLLIWIAMAAVLTFVLAFTTLGRRIYAVGKNPNVARFSGIDVALVQVGAYTLAGALASIAGVLLVGWVSVSSLGMGDPYLFQTVAAVAIGGASILGGTGSYFGTAAGAFTLTVLSALLPVFNLDAWAQDVLFGVVVLIAIAVIPRGNQA
jgi:ribose transport system permease protein